MENNIIKKHMKDKYAFDRKLIFLYFFFLVFEGAFRKWIMPGASSLFVVIRDPIVLLLVLRGLKRGWLNNCYCFLSIILSIVSFLFSFVLDKTNIVIQYYGTRIFLLYFPAIFVIAKVLNKQDILKIGKYTIYISIPMTILVVTQYFSPQTSWVNRGVGGDLEGSGFGGAMGYFRPSGIFSFTQGFTVFQSFVLSYILIFFYNENLRKMLNLRKSILYLATICYIICIPVSISRTILFETIAIISFLILGMLLTGSKKIKKTLVLSLGIVILIPILMSIPEVQLFTEVYNTRFEEASYAEGNIVQGTIIERYLGSFLRAWYIDVPFWGHGIGLGTRLAFTYFPNINFITDEEWTRIIFESGYLLGTIYILLRVILAFQILIRTIKITTKTKDITPILFLPCVLFLLPQGSFGNAVPLGFAVLSTGIMLSMLKKNESFSISSNR